MSFHIAFTMFIYWGLFNVNLAFLFEFTKSVYAWGETAFYTKLGDTISG